MVDFFFTLFLTLLLLASSLGIFYATPNYQEAISIQENLKERSGLYINDKEAPIYLSEESLTIKDLFFYTVGSFSVSLAISGICFLSSSIFNKTKYSIGVGGGISVFFLVSSILGLFGSEVMPLALRIDSMNFFNYLTIIRLFDVQSILDETNTFFYLLIPLLAISVVTYLIGCIVFTKKDLPL